ncbi:hypothetical protein U1769_09000 [Sphingomonas sp. ZT3P38]|uniref:hypothetical protein n=1 Tax=Parasphingomonas zepuensis TaxID=3096161 RepID=UPI002FCB44CF
MDQAKTFACAKTLYFAQWKANTRGNLGTVEFARAITSENITVVRDIANFMIGRELRGGNRLRPEFEILPSAVGR